MAKLRRCSYHDKAVTCVKGNATPANRLTTKKEGDKLIRGNVSQGKRAPPRPTVSRYLFEDDSSEESYDMYRAKRLSQKKSDRDDNCEICLVGQTLRCLGDELDLDKQFQRMLKQILRRNSSVFLLKEVAAEVFADGSFNWGRVITFIYFTYRILSQNIAKSKIKSAVLAVVHLPIWLSYTVLTYLIKFTIYVIENARNDEQALTLVTFAISGIVALIIVINLSDQRPS